MDTAEKLVKTSIADTVGGIVISRPKALNALNAAVLAQLHEAVAALAGDDTVRVIVISGEGGKAFVVRADSPAGEALTADDVTAFAREHLANFKVPRQVEFTGALPRNLSGKVLKKDLR